jgi:hypothetical protein
MNSNYINALARKHAQIDREIEEAQKSHVPDTLVIMQLKKIRLAYRDRLKAAIAEKRQALANGGRHLPPAVTAKLAPAFQPQQSGRN